MVNLSLLVDWNNLSMFPIYRHGALFKGCLVDERQYWCNLSGIVFQEPGRNRIRSSGFVGFNCFEEFSHTSFTYYDIWKTLYLLVPKFGTLLLPPFMKTDENWVLRISALVWLSLWTMPFFVSGATPLL